MPGGVLRWVLPLVFLGLGHDGPLDAGVATGMRTPPVAKLRAWRGTASAGGPPQVVEHGVNRLRRYDVLGQAKRSPLCFGGGALGLVLAVVGLNRVIDLLLILVTRSSVLAVG